MNQLDAFQQRLERIKNREQQGLALGHVETSPTRRAVGLRLGGFLTAPFLLILSASLGLIAVLALRLAFFHLAGATPAEQITSKDIALTAGLSFAAAFIFAQILGLSSRLQTLALIGGVALAMTGFHNLFHWVPSQMEAAFSPDYARGMTAMAGPNSLLFGSESYQPITADSPLIATLTAWTAGPTEMAEAELESGITPKRLKLDSQQ